MTARYTPSDYAPVIQGTGAKKLADSGVAPLVAVARGYRSYARADLELAALATTIADAVGLSGNRPAKNKVRRWLAEADSDLLLMPWQNMAKVAEGGASSADAQFHQVRPSHPLPSERGGKQRPAKYDAFADMRTSLDIHPSTPTSWIGGAHTIVMTEGIIKGDSALTAMLLDAGVPSSDLEISDVPSDETERAAWAREQTRRLETIMGDVDEARRVVIVSFLGVSNWRQNPEWASLRLSDRKVLIAFDGDLRTNIDVHTQATHLFEFLDKKGARPALIDLGSATVRVQQRESEWEDAFPDAKIGLDDYLAWPVGTWRDALGLATTDFPPPPQQREEDYALDGDVRVSSDGCKIEQASIDKDSGRANWRTVDRIGGRLLSVSTARIPSQNEIMRGVIEEGADTGARLEARIQVSWRDANGQIQTAIVSGPGEMLETDPRSWSRASRQGKVDIPAKLLSEAVWPPQSGMSWLRAIKKFPSESLTTWEAMGWAPTKHGDPVFIIGSQVLGRTREDEQSVIRGITERNFSGASEFGVIDTYWDEIDPDGDGQIDQDGLASYKAGVRETIETMVRIYIRDSAWRDPEIGPTALAFMVRPCLPIPWTGALFLWGPPGVGKSFTGSFIIAGWTHTPGTFHENHMPATASDTQYSMEWTNSRMPVIAYDDSAASTDIRAANGRAEAIEGMIRQVANGSTRRAAARDHDGLREATVPRATVMVTSENEPRTQSIRERTVMLRPSKGSIDNSEIIHLVRSADGPGHASRLTAAMLRFWFEPHGGFSDRDPVVTDWTDKIRRLQRQQDELIGTIQQYLGEQHNLDERETTRQARLIGGLLVSLRYVAELYRWAGGDPREFVRELSFSHDESRLLDVADYAAKMVSQHRSTAIGRSLMLGIANLLFQGKGHVTGAVPGQPPFGTDGGADVNEALGWVMDPNRGWTPRGLRIGTAGSIGGIDTVVFNRDAAFSAVQREGGYIQPGQTSKTTWSAAVSEGVVKPPEKKTFSGGTGDNGERIRTSPIGPWITLEQLLALGESGGEIEVDSAPDE